jgi:hypothetical protein
MNSGLYLHAVASFAAVWYEGFAHNAVKLFELHKKLVYGRH